MKADNPAASEWRDGSRANKIQAACLHVRWKKRLVELSEDFMRKRTEEMINRLYGKAIACVSSTHRKIYIVL